MLSWLYKNRGLPGMPKPTAAETAAAKRSAELKLQRQVEQQAKVQAAAQAAQRAAEKAELKAKEADEARAAWQPRLLAAMGDDTALLGVAQATPVLEIKLAAIEGAERALPLALAAVASADFPDAELAAAAEVLAHGEGASPIWAWLAVTAAAPDVWDDATIDATVGSAGFFTASIVYGGDAAYLGAASSTDVPDPSPPPPSSRIAFPNPLAADRVKR